MHWTVVAQVGAAAASLAERALTLFIALNGLVGQQATNNVAIQAAVDAAVQATIQPSRPDRGPSCHTNRSAACITVISGFICSNYRSRPAFICSNHRS